MVSECYLLYLCNNKVVVKKKKKKQGPTPMQRQLMETNDFMKWGSPPPLSHQIPNKNCRYKMDEFEACCTGGERVLLAYHNIPEESTTIDRWEKKLTF